MGGTASAPRDSPAAARSDSSPASSPWKPPPKSVDSLPSWSVAGPTAFSRRRQLIPPDSSFAIDDDVNAKLAVWLGGGLGSLQADAIAIDSDPDNRSSAPVLAATGPLPPCDTPSRIPAPSSTIPATFILQIPSLDSSYSTALSFIDGGAIRTLGIAPASLDRCLRAAREFLSDPSNRLKTGTIVIVADYYSESALYRSIPAFFPLALPKWEVGLADLKTWADEGAERPPAAVRAKFAASAAVNAKVSFWMGGDSSRLAADAIVNAANEWLAAGGGICGVIHAAAGPKLAEECERVGHTRTGLAAKTGAYDLPAKFVIHAVGPTCEDPVALKSAYEETLKYIDGGELRSVGLCCISTGIFGYPIRPATHIALETVREFLDSEENREKTDRIVFVVFERKDVDVYYDLIPEYFPIADVE